MAPVTGKRKREDVRDGHVQFGKKTLAPQANGVKKPFGPEHENPKQKVANAHVEPNTGLYQTAAGQDITIQVVTGSYERSLHGVYATIPEQLLHGTAKSLANTEAESSVTFQDNFLFAAHTSAVRCLALSSSTESGNRILATGGSDERINLYNLSTAPPPASKAKRPSSSLVSIPAAATTRNRSLGNLIHHDRAITCLQFPIKSKLFSAAEDNTVAISRTRDWTVLSSIKAPIPKPQGRPSGDTAGPGEIPAGINDFAIHPSQKLMLSVSRGEKCMRLWNLMTGKKAGVLNFDRDLLIQAGEGKYSSGEGRKVLWDTEGESFVIEFERAAVLFGIDSKPKAIIRPSPASKFHQMKFLSLSAGSSRNSVLAVSTEDGRIIFFDTLSAESEVHSTKLPSCNLVAQLGGPLSGISGRVKDFEVVTLPAGADDGRAPLLVATGSSDGAIRLWTLFEDELTGSPSTQSTGSEAADTESTGTSDTPAQVGKMIGTIETGNRITCLGAFIMDGEAAAVENYEYDQPGSEDGSDDDSGDSD